MKNFFNIDSPLMIFMSDLTDLIILNVVFLICCIPIVTIGPAITAMHYVTLKMVKDENGSVLKNFFKSFKENFKQSLIVWLIFVVISLVFIIDLKILNNMGINENKIFATIVGAIYIFFCFIAMYSFPLLARFENSLKQTIKNAFLMSILHIFKTIIMAVFYAIPVVLIPLHTTMIAVYLLMGASVSAYINSFFWNSIFKKYEPAKAEEEITKDEDFVIMEE